MKTNIASIFAVATLALFTAACTNEETTKQEASQEETIAGMTFVGGSAVKTRTSLDVTLPGGTTVDYFWEPNDKIWTADGATGTAQITSKSATANFRMSKAYTTSTVDVYYPGTNATAYNQVTIATNQTQTEPNSTKHLGAAGDCGTAIAHRQSDNSYKFDLDHKASYLCLLPRTPNKLVSTYISQIKITADNNIAGTYTLTNTGLTGSGSSNTITITTSGSSHPYGFPLNNATTSQSTNAIYAVIAPGTHALTIEYSFEDNVTHNYGTITKTIASTAYDENTVYPLTANISLPEYPGDGYYMWDAQDQYWKGFEWDGTNPTQPTINGQSNSTDAPKSTYTTSAHTSRDFNDIMGYSDGTGAAPAVLPTTSHFQACPNINELLWYAQNGEPHWDYQMPWVMMGHLYSTVMWFKKKSKISGYRTDQAPDGIDYTKNTSFSTYANNTISYGKPVNLNDYFYLPMLGYNGSGTLDWVGRNGFYWGSTPAQWSTSEACCLEFDTSSVAVGNIGRYYGCQLWTAQ